MKLTDIFHEYEVELGNDHEELLDYKYWREVWRDVFPNVKLRQYKAVSGIIYLVPAYT